MAAAKARRTAGSARSRTPTSPAAARLKAGVLRSRSISAAPPWRGSITWSHSAINRSSATLRATLRAMPRGCDGVTRMITERVRSSWVLRLKRMSGPGTSPRPGTRELWPSRTVSDRPLSTSVSPKRISAVAATLCLKVDSCSLKLPAPASLKKLRSASTRKRAPSARTSLGVILSVMPTSIFSSAAVLTPLTWTKSCSPTKKVDCWPAKAVRLGRAITS